MLKFLILAMLQSKYLFKVSSHELLFAFSVNTPIIYFNLCQSQCACYLLPLRCLVSSILPFLENTHAPCSLFRNTQNAYF